MVKVSSIEAVQKKKRAFSAIEAELNAAKKESDEAESAMDAFTSEREAILIDASDEQVLAIEKKIDIQRLRMERAEKRIGLLTDELETARQDSISTALVARAEELCKKTNPGAALGRLTEALRAAAAILSEINQHNAEAGAINPHLPDGSEYIPIIDSRITHLPGEWSLMRLLTSQLSTLSACFQQPITVSPPGPAAYPEPVKAALAKLEERRRAQIAAARTRPHHAGPSMQPTFFTTTPDPLPET
jgi:hypothetical protein